MLVETIACQSWRIFLKHSVEMYESFNRRLLKKIQIKKNMKNMQLN